jgi:hypothetical protein
VDTSRLTVSAVIEGKTTLQEIYAAERKAADTEVLRNFL